MVIFSAGILEFLKGKYILYYKENEIIFEGNIISSKKNSSSLSYIYLKFVDRCWEPKESMPFKKPDIHI